MSSSLGNILLNISVIILVVLVGFIAIIITYSKLKSINMKDATKVVVRVLKDIYEGIFNTEIPKQVLRLGTIDGVHYSVEQIYLVFNDVVQLFRTCIFINYREYRNLTIFQFKAKFLLVTMENRVLIDLIASIVEKPVNTILHSMGTFIFTDSYVAVRYQNGLLEIAVAKNEDGFKAIESLKAEALKELLSVDDFNEEAMTEEWKNTK